MEDFNKIGLNIWGIRGGYRSFCHSTNLDVEMPEIKNTWKDIREFAYVTDLTVRFYALEFTTEYKVFTLYRPENDTSRTGAYVATTLYVPHALKVIRILDLMRQISDAYHKDHYDAFGNPNTNPDYIQNYWELIKNYAGNIVRERDVRSWESSAQDNTPRIMPFTSLSVVEEFFDKPYRKEFLRHQEVMFWDNDYLQNQQSHGVKFQKMETLGSMFETNGKGVAQQFEGGSIKNRLQEITIERFEREGVDITQNWQSYCFYDKTNIVIVLKKPFHQPKTYNGTLIGIGSPFVKRGDDYEFSSARVDFQPRQYDIPVNVVNIGNAPITLYFGNESVIITGGRGVFHFDGSKANGACKVTLRPDGYKEIKVTDFAMSKFFVTGSDNLDPLQTCTIDSLRMFRFQFSQECRGWLDIRWQGSIEFSTINKVFEVVLPAEYKASDFTFKVDGYEASIKVANENSAVFDVMLAKQSYIVDIIIPPSLMRYVYPDRFVLKVGGKSYKGFPATIPVADRDSQYKLGIDVDGRGGLIACDCVNQPNNDDVRLLPKLALLRNDTNDKVRLTAPNISFEVFANTTIVVPANYEPTLKEADKYKVEPQTNSEGIKTSIITAKATTVTKSPGSDKPTTPNSTGGSQSGGNYVGYQGGGNYVGYQGGGNYVGYQGGNASSNRPFYGCFYYEGVEKKVFNDVTEKKGDDAYEIKIDGRPCVLCFDKGKNPLPEKQKKYTKVNKKNGFIVDVSNGKINVVPNAKSTETQDNSDNGSNGGGSDDGGKKKRWLLFGGLGVVIIALVTLGLVLGFGRGSKKPVYTINIQMTNNTEIDHVVAERMGREDSRIETIDNNTIHLKKGWDQVEIQIFTKFEGDCVKINVDSAKKVNHLNAKPFYKVTPDKDTMTLTVTSPAWMEFEAIGNDSGLTDTFAIKKYAALANKFSSAKYVVKSCIDKAKGLVNETNDGSLNCFIENFKKIPEARTFVKEYETKKNTNAQKEQDKINIEKKIAAFKTAMAKVYSMECTKGDVNALDQLYDELCGLITDKLKIKTDVVLPVVREKSSQGETVTISEKWFKDDFITNQNKFFKVFDENSKVKLSQISNLTKNTACFSKKQISAITKLTKTNDAFFKYTTFKTQCTNKQYYDYIEKNNFN